MSDLNKNQPNEQVEQEVKTEQEELKKESQYDIQALVKENEALKKQQSGQDSANTKLQKQIKDLQAKIEAVENEGLSKEELFEKQQKEWEAQKNQQQKELQEKQKIIDRNRAIIDSKIDPDLGDLIKGDSYEEYLKSAQKIMEKINISVEKNVKSELGAVDKNTIKTGNGLTKPEAYDQAIKEGNFKEALRLAK